MTIIVHKKNISEQKIAEYLSLKVNTVASSGASVDLSFDYAIHDITVDENCIFTFSDAPSGAGSVILVRLTQGGVGGFTKTFPSAVEWPGGIEPTMIPNATGDVSEYLIIWNGSAYSGSVRGDDFS